MFPWAYSISPPSPRSVSRAGPCQPEIPSPLGCLSFLSQLLFVNPRSHAALVAVFSVSFSSEEFPHLFVSIWGHLLGLGRSAQKFSSVPLLGGPSRSLASLLSMWLFTFWLMCLLPGLHCRVTVFPCNWQPISCGRPSGTMCLSGFSPCFRWLVWPSAILLAGSSNYCAGRQMVTIEFYPLPIVGTLLWFRAPDLPHLLIRSCVAVSMDSRVFPVLPAPIVSCCSGCPRLSRWGRLQAGSSVLLTIPIIFWAPVSGTSCIWPDPALESNQPFLWRVLILFIENDICQPINRC